MVLRVGIIGTGFFGAFHARATAKVEGIQITAAAGSSLSEAQRFAAGFGGTPHDNWECLIEDPNVDAVVIATPHHLHEAIAIKSALAGKHVLLEKPMAPTRKACEAIAQAIKAANVELLVGQTMHFALPCIKAKEIVESGIIGRPRIGMSSLVKRWMEANRSNWHLRRETGGGMLLTAGIHALDRLVWLIGDDVTGVSSITATKFHDQPADDTSLLTLRFSNGALGQVQSVGCRDKSNHSSTVLICDDGILHLDFETGVSFCRNGTWTDVPDSIEPDWMFEAVAREWTCFKSLVEGNAVTHPSIDYCTRLVSVIEAAFEASELKREIEI